MRYTFAWFFLVIGGGLTPAICRLFDHPFSDNQTTIWGAAFISSLIISQTIRDVFGWK